MRANVQPLMEPNVELMQRHLEHLFGGFLDGCHDGLIEIVYTDPADRKLRHAKLFGTDEIEEAAAFAYEHNNIQGQNLYVGAALRKPETPRDRRASDNDILALTAFYVDLDENEAAAQAKQRYRGCPPTCAVVTGRKPHTRVQLWWRQDVPERDLAQARLQNAALAAALNGDRTVVNPSRVMRLAGSIAWPQKEGRVLEQTELQLFNDDRPKSFPEGQIARAFPPLTEVVQDNKPQAALNIGTPDALSIEATLHAIRNGQQWHNNLLRLVGHWIARGWSDSEILLAAEALTLPGYRVDQTRRDAQSMITGARAKWAIPNPVNTLDEFSALPLPFGFVEDLNIAMLPRRRWVLGRCLLIGHLTVLVAPPGLGKTTLVIAQAIAVAVSRNLTGQEVHEQGKVWVFNNEDDGDELKRRIAAILQHFQIPLDDIKGRLAFNSGADRPLMLAKADPRGVVTRQPDVTTCIELIKRHGIKAMVVDPFIETHEVDENSNEQIKIVAQLFREIARAADCAIMLVHHTAKPPQGSSSGHAGNMNTARGASSLVGVARIVMTLFGMSEKDARMLGIREEERHLFIRLDDAKANMSLISPHANWYKRISVMLPNQDEVGVLEPVDLKPLAQDAKPEDIDSEFHRTIIACLLARVKEDEVTLNAAAKALAWSGDERFARFGYTSQDGSQRVTSTLRQYIIAACTSNTLIVSSGEVRGFTIDQTTKVATLKRFSRPVGMAELAAEPPEFSSEFSSENGDENAEI